MKVRVHGPNLSGKGQEMGYFHVHRDGCAHNGNYGPGRKYGGDDAGWVFDADSKADVARNLFCDVASDYGDEGSAEYEEALASNASDLYYAPCAKGMS